MIVIVKYTPKPYSNSASALVAVRQEDWVSYLGFFGKCNSVVETARRETVPGAGRTDRLRVGRLGHLH